MKRLAIVGAALTLAALPALAQQVTPPPASERSGGVELAFLNGVYQDLDSGLVPIEQGPLTFQVASPEHRVAVHGNRLWLEPAPGGTWRIDVEVDFEGEGRLDVDVTGPGIAQRLSDEVAAPRQTVRAHATVRVEPRFAPGDTEDIAGTLDGWLFTVAEPGPAVAIVIESALVGQLTNLCRVFDALPVLSVDCGALENALSTVRVPQPETGRGFYLPAAYLGEAERAYFEGLVRAAVPSG